MFLLSVKMGSYIFSPQNPRSGPQALTVASILPAAY